MSRHEECVAVVGQLWPYLDGALPDDAQARIVAHLEDCANCRSHFDFEREFLVAVRVAGAEGDFGPLRDRVLSALHAQGFTQA